jgi:hypothetical protein
LRYEDRIMIQEFSTHEITRLFLCLRDRVDLLSSRLKVKYGDSWVNELRTLCKDLEKTSASDFEKLDLELVYNPPSFFKRDFEHYCNEIRQILCGNYVVCERLNIINSPVSEKKFTNDEFDRDAKQQFVLIALEKFREVVSSKIEEFNSGPTSSCCK